jgi:group I intron endonuclease
MSGRTHSEETRKKISDTANKIENYGRFKTGENNPMFGKNHSEETILKISEAKMGKNLSDEVRKKMSDTAKKIDNPGRFKAGENHPPALLFSNYYSRNSCEKRRVNYGKPKLAGSGTPAQAIEVFDNKTNQTTNFESIAEAARILDIRWEAIKNYLARNQQKPYKGRYNFTLKK